MKETEAEIADLIAGSYDVGPITDIKIFRRHTNDVYLVKTTDNQYIAKFYPTTWRNETELLYELDLLNHLKRKGVGVANVLPTKHSTPLPPVAKPSNRHWALFEYAAGKKPTHPFTPALYARFGIAAANLHTALDDFSSMHGRRPLDLSFLIDEPLRILQPIANEDDMKALEAAAIKTKAALTPLIGSMDWGAIHGDMTLDNLHITDEGFVFYDFDSGGPGWRAFDLHGVYQYQKETDNGVWDAFLKSYTSIRSLSQADIEALSYFHIAQIFWGMWISLTQRLRASSLNAKKDYISKRTAMIQRSL